MTGKIPAEHAKKSRAYKPPSDGELVRMQKSAGEFQMPAPYPQHLAEFLFEYRQSDILPRTAFEIGRAHV